MGQSVHCLQTTYTTRLYRVIERGTQVYMEPVAITSESLDPRFVFLLDLGLQMYVWCGRKCKGVLRSKTRLFAEKMNKNERKGTAEIEQINQLHEPPEFWHAINGVDTKPEEPIVEHVPSDFTPETPKLYQLKLGMGYLELPQLVRRCANHICTLAGTTQRPTAPVDADGQGRLSARLQLGRVPVDG